MLAGLDRQALSMFGETITITTLITALLIIGGYLLGSISTAIIVCRMLGLPDPRTVGSNNPGATNVLRHGGKKAAAITLLGDMLKGLLAVLLARLISDNPLDPALAGLAAFLGHLYPVFFHFRGGKGVATYFGALLGINWMAGLVALVCWLLIARVFKISSLAALLTAVVVPAALWWLQSHNLIVAIAVFMSVLLIWRHRSNIHKLISGDEDRIANKSDQE